MHDPERFSNLPDPPFPRLRALLDAHPPGDRPLSLSIGEPRHAMPDFVGPVLAAHLDQFANYPAGDGSADLLAAIADWHQRRYGLYPDPATRLMALNGSREGITGTTLALCPEQVHGVRPVVLIPNPFYQAYAFAAVAAGAEPVFVPADPQSGHLPDYTALSPGLLERTAIAWVASPANPQGAVASAGWWRDLLALAEKHDFKIFSDECYSEIWRTTPPVGLLQAAQAAGADPERVVTFNSLSKRSNLPGLRSGFVAAGPRSMALIRRLRGAAGAPLPGPIQAVSAAVWRDEGHVDASRARYQAKYALAEAILGDLPGFVSPEAGFFLWLRAPQAGSDTLDDGEAATLKLWHETGIRVLAGSYLGRDVGHGNPGAGFIRIALVADEAELEDGLRRLRACLYDT